MSELEKLCRELYDDLKIITDWVDDNKRYGWDKHRDREFHNNIEWLYSYRERLAELLHIEND
jgi:hypothetical protein